MAELSIGEVARRAGIAASAIRFYEREHLLPRAHRRGGRRVYGEDVLDRLDLIDLAKRAGFTVAEIRRLLHGFEGSTPPGVRWRTLAESKIAQLEQRIREAQQMRELLSRVTSCACPTLDDCGAARRSLR